MKEFENMSHVWESMPDGGEEREIILVGEQKYIWIKAFGNWLLYDEAYNNTILEGDLTVGRDVTVGGNHVVRGSGTVEGNFEVRGKLVYGASGADIDKIEGDLTVDGNLDVKKGLKVSGEIETDKILTPNLGLFLTLESLVSKHPSPAFGSYAIVGKKIPGPLYQYGETGWQPTGEEGQVSETLNLEDYYSKEEIDKMVIKDIVTDSNFSGLDKYPPMASQGFYRLVSENGNFVYGYMMCFPWLIGSNGYQLVFGSKIYNKQAGNINNPTIIWRAFTGFTPGEWQPIQKLFVSDDGNTPSVELENTMFAPSMRLFNQKMSELGSVNKDATTVILWSGKFVHDVVVFDTSSSAPPLEVINIYYPDNICYDDTKKTFLCLYNGIYYPTFKNIELFQENTYSGTTPFTAGFTSNLFKGTDGILYTAVNGEILPVSNIYRLPGNFKTLFDYFDKNTSYPSDFTALSYFGKWSDLYCAASLNKTIITNDNVVLQYTGVSGIAVFPAEPKKLSFICKTAINKNYKLELVASAAEADTPEEEWKLSLNMDSFSGIADAPKDGKTYGRSNGSWAEIVASGTSPVYTIGDIFSLTTSSTNEQIEAIIGSVSDFTAALNAGKLFVCKWGLTSNYPNSAPASVQSNLIIGNVVIRVVYTSILYSPSIGDCIDISLRITDGQWSVVGTDIKNITKTDA